MKIHVEIFIASRILSQTKNLFTPYEIMKFINKEFNDERAGIMTYITGACVANAPLNHMHVYNYLWRVSHGKYRTFRPGSDYLKYKKFNGIIQPAQKDMPEKFLNLLNNE